MTENILQEGARISEKQLKSFIERLEHVAEEKVAIDTDFKEVLMEAKHAGFDPKILRLLLKLRKMRQEDRQEQEALLDVYEDALGRAR